jgi:PBP1b-binding outer membrane lipoprotein LpoB
MRLLKCLPVFICLCLILYGCASDTAGFKPKREVVSYDEKILNTDQFPSLDLTNNSGNIEIYSWDRREIKFEIKKRIRGMGSEEILKKDLDGFRIEFKQENDDFYFISSYNGPIKSQIDRAIDLNVTIPKDIKSISCQLDVGKIKIHDDIKCELKFKINMANIDINRFDGIINLKADMSDLRISGGRLKDGSNIKINMGNIQVKAELEEGSYNFDTNMGNIDLSFPSESDINLETIGTVEQNEFISSSNLVFLRVRSGMGKIAIKKY